MIEAREQILYIQASTYPHLKQAKQEKLFRELHRLAYPIEMIPKQKTDMEGLARMLSK